MFLDIDDVSNNEFKPSTWTTYMYYPGTTETAPTAQTSPLARSGSLYVFVAAVIIVVIVAGVLYLGLRRGR